MNKIITIPKRNIIINNVDRGSGLDLPLVHHRVKDHEWIFEETNEKGEGNTNVMYSPASEKDNSKEKGRIEGFLKGTETVLLVDDEDMIADVGKQVLVVMGYKVIIAKSGRQAIDKYERNQEEIDMVILDMIMPETDGGETFDNLKKLNPDIKVLLSSGYNVDGQATEILKRGCNGFIQKPFNMKQLSQKVREILDQ